MAPPRRLTAIQQQQPWYPSPVRATAGRVHDATGGENLGDPAARDGSCVLTITSVRASLVGGFTAVEGGDMAWQLEGTYFESCSCDAVCPCTWSALTAKATLDRCRALLAYHIGSGAIDGVDVSGLSFALFLDTPPVMS